MYDKKNLGPGEDPTHDLPFKKKKDKYNNHYTTIRSQATFHRPDEVVGHRFRHENENLQFSTRSGPRNLLVIFLLTTSSSYYAEIEDLCWTFADCESAIHLSRSSYLVVVGDMARGRGELISIIAVLMVSITTIIVMMILAVGTVITMTTATVRVGMTTTSCILLHDFGFDLLSLSRLKTHCFLHCSLRTI